VFVKFYDYRKLHHVNTACLIKIRYHGQTGNRIFLFASLLSVKKEILADSSLSFVLTTDISPSLSVNHFSSTSPALDLENMTSIDIYDPKYFGAYKDLEEVKRYNAFHGTFFGEGLIERFDLKFDQESSTMVANMIFGKELLKGNFYSLEKKDTRGSGGGGILGSLLSVVNAIDPLFSQLSSGSKMVEDTSEENDTDSDLVAHEGLLFLALDNSYAWCCTLAGVQPVFTETCNVKFRWVSSRDQHPRLEITTPVSCEI